MRTSTFARRAVAALAAPALVLALAATCYAQAGGPAKVTEFSIAYPDNAQALPRRGCHVAGVGASPMGSTHEITFNERGGGDLWISGQNYDALVRGSRELDDRLRH